MDLILSNPKVEDAIAASSFYCSGQLEAQITGTSNSFAFFQNAREILQIFPALDFLRYPHFWNLPDMEL